MDAITLKEILETELNLEQIIVNGEGSHFEVIAIDPCFETLSRVKKQQLIYQPLSDKIKTNEIHALSIKTWTPEAWAKQQKLMG